VNGAVAGVRQLGDGVLMYVMAPAATFDDIAVRNDGISRHSLEYRRSGELNIYLRARAGRRILALLRGAAPPCLQRAPRSVLRCTFCAYPAARR